MAEPGWFLPPNASSVAVLVFLTVALAGLELTVAGSWADATLDIGGIHSGSVSGVMNTLGNLGGHARGDSLARPHHGSSFVTTGGC